MFLLMNKFNELLTWIRSLCTTKRILVCIVVSIIAYILVGCTSTKHMSVVVDTADNLKVDYLDSVKVELKR